jgi:exopolysaccharide biosynthesis WecB/TagA/CpsF family protein
MLIKESAPDRRELLGILFDPFTIEDVLGLLRAVRPTTPFSYVVTPNVDHLVRLDRLNPGDPRAVEIRQAYEAAAVCVCDSRVLARLAVLAGTRLTVVPGSDLTAQLFATVVDDGDEVAIVGGDEATLPALRQLFPAISFMQHIPPMGLLTNEPAMAEAASFAAGSGARFTLLAIGSPQQELLAKRIANLPEAGGCALCIGAAVEFIGGQRKRAPVVLQKLSLEWSYRLIKEPRRLWRRYAVDGPNIVPMLIRWRVRKGKPAR